MDDFRFHRTIRETSQLSYRNAAFNCGTAKSGMNTNFRYLFHVNFCFCPFAIRKKSLFNIYPKSLARSTYADVISSPP